MGSFKKYFFNLFMAHKFLLDLPKINLKICSSLNVWWKELRRNSQNVVSPFLAPKQTRTLRYNNASSTRTRTRTHTHARAHMHTHTRTHTQSNLQDSRLFWLKICDFSDFYKNVPNWWTNGPTDRRKDRWIKGWTHPLIEMRGRI